VSVWANVAAGPALPTDVVDAAVVGGGPAAYTAAIYLARAKAGPVVLAGAFPGGQLMDTGIVENFPGFPDGIDGPELMTRMREQAERAGATVFALDATEMRFAADGEAPVHEIATASGELRARSVILATGSSPRALGVPGEAELGGGKGVAYCAVCEAPLFVGRDVAVVGGGDSAMEEALALAKHARHVWLIHRRESFRAAPVMLDRVRALPNVEIRTGAIVKALHAGGDGRLARIAIEETATGATQEIAAQGLFVAIGHTPRSGIVSGALPLSATDHIHVSGPGGATQLPGVFVAGDVRHGATRRVATGVGEGAGAVPFIHQYLATV
jgi:thioredoxin reductase (NADPH)